MHISRSGTICILIFAFLLIIAFPVSVRCEDASQTDGDNGGSESEGRALPQLDPGKWEPLFELGENIYPSVAISTATLKSGMWSDKEHLGDPWGVIGIAVRGSQDNCPVRVEISGGSFIKPSVFTGTLPGKDTVYCIYPSLKYDYEKLLAVKQTVPETLSFKVNVGKTEDPEKIVRVQVRPVNECVFNFVDSSNNTNDVSFFFAAFVNENHPFISEIMKEALADKRVDSFSGYSGDRDSVMQEIEAVWETLKNRGMHYGTMPASADDDSSFISSQYVRLMGESLKYEQANCVDGSVLMASIFRKLGLNASLIELPDHMFVAVDLDSDGKETAFIETTMLSDSTLEEAMEEGNDQFEKDKDKFDSKKQEDQAYNIVNIQDARVLGIIPIKDSSVN